MGKITLSSILEQKPGIIYTSELPIDNDKNDIRVIYKRISFRLIKDKRALINVLKVKNKIHGMFDGEYLILSMNAFSLIKNHYEKQNITITVPDIITDYLTINREKLL